MGLRPGAPLEGLLRRRRGRARRCRGGDRVARGGQRRGRRGRRTGRDGRSRGSERSCISAGTASTQPVLERLPVEGTSRVAEDGGLGPARGLEPCDAADERSGGAARQGVESLHADDAVAQGIGPVVRHRIRGEGTDGAGSHPVRLTEDPHELCVRLGAEHVGVGEAGELPGAQLHPLADLPEFDAGTGGRDEHRGVAPGVRKQLEELPT